MQFLIDQNVPLDREYKGKQRMSVAEQSVQYWLNLWQQADWFIAQLKAELADTPFWVIFDELIVESETNKIPSLTPLAARIIPDDPHDWVTFQEKVWVWTTPRELNEAGLWLNPTGEIKPGIHTFLDENKRLGYKPGPELTPPPTPTGTELRHRTIVTPPDNPNHL